jgi:aminoglycoside/choline kinase family phosphotransferase
MDSFPFWRNKTLIAGRTLQRLACHPRRCFDLLVTRRAIKRNGFHVRLRWRSGKEKARPNAPVRRHCEEPCKEYAKPRPLGRELGVVFA